MIISDDEEEVEKLEVYPETFDVKNIKSCCLSGSRYSRDGYLDVTSIDNKHYRIKEPALLKILKGEVQTLLVAYTYDRYHLVYELPGTYLKRKKLKKHESKCPYCNGHGMIAWMICDHCKGTSKINWIQNVFAK